MDFLKIFKRKESNSIAEDTFSDRNRRLIREISEEFGNIELKKFINDNIPPFKKNDFIVPRYYSDNILFNYHPKASSLISIYDDITPGMMFKVDICYASKDAFVQRIENHLNAFVEHDGYSPKTFFKNKVSIFLKETKITCDWCLELDWKFNKDKAPIWGGFLAASFIKITNPLTKIEKRLYEIENERKTLMEKIKVINDKDIK